MDIDAEIYKASQNEWHVPMFNAQEWKELCCRNKTEGDIHDGCTIIISAIQRYILNHKPPLPISRPSIKKMKKDFITILESSHLDHIKTDIDKELIRNKFDEKVNVDYILSAGSSTNGISNHFQCENRYTCGHHKAKSTAWAWANPMSKRTHSMFLFLFRPFANTSEHAIDIVTWRTMFRLSGYVATQFKPMIAKTVYDGANAKSVIDISCGWGDRLAGFYTSKAKDYLGCDPNPISYNLYKKQCIAYEEILNSPLFPTEYEFVDHGDWFEINGNKRVRIYNKPAEDMNWSSIVGAYKYDLMFTSPPYFGIERYGEDDDSTGQSWKRYNDYTLWRDHFFFPVMDAMNDVCNKTMINIVDPVVNNVRYPIEKDILGRYGISNILGMAMSNRRIARKEACQMSGNDIKFIEPIYVLM
tara:strand:- start:25126 stop:26370 length:1245 start_codon:yes stop_codon:yes gene_type:complete